MSAPVAVTFFGVRNPEGRCLYELFSRMCKEEFGLTVKYCEGATQTDIYRACTSDDLIVLDASIEEGHNYAATTAQPMAMDHVLVVSRTYLPLNFYGLREGGAPGYPQPKVKSNGEIVEWLRQELRDLAPRLPRPDNEKSFIGSIRTMREGLRLQEARWRSAGRIFISYRSRHLEEVQRLKTAIERGDFHSGVEQTVRLLMPGELVYENELFTEQQHWQLVSMIDRRLGAAEELWIYETDDYFASWWTRAELVTVSYRRASGASAPRVYAYDSARGRVRALDDNFLPSMSREQERRMARWYANSDPGTMGPESVTPIRILAQLPIIGHFKFFNDHVWSDEFWSYLLLPCAVCAARRASTARINLEEFLWLRESHLIRLSPEQLAEGEGPKEVNCPVCGSPYVVEEDDSPRYLWMPTRAGVPTTPDGSGLLKIPVYRGSRKLPAHWIARD